MRPPHGRACRSPEKMRFEDALQHLYVDGSWRDIYALNASDTELNRFMAFVLPFLGDDSFRIGGEVDLIPLSYGEVYNHSSNLTKHLSIPVGTGTVNCHFFCDDELELDFRPQDYNSPEQWEHLDSFLRGLAKAMQRDLIVTAENQPNTIHIKYEEGEQVAP